MESQCLSISPDILASYFRVLSTLGKAKSAESHGVFTFS